jgi:hypothetical protein
MNCPAKFRQEQPCSFPKHILPCSTKLRKQNRVASIRTFRHFAESQDTTGRLAEVGYAAMLRLNIQRRGKQANPEVSK